MHVPVTRRPCRSHHRATIPFILFSFYALAAVDRASATSFNISNASTTRQTLAAGETGTVTSTGSLTVTGNNVAITVTGNSTITNNGTVQQTSVLAGGNAGNSRAIRDNTGGLTLTIDNGSSTNSTALIQTADADVIQMRVAGSTVTLNNYGTLDSQNSSGGGNQAVDWNGLKTTAGRNTLNNHSTGIISATEADAVRPGVNGVVNNDGLIKSNTSTGSSSDGVDAQTNSGIAVTNASTLGSGSGLIEGARHGITGGAVIPSLGGDGTFILTVTNNSGGTIQGDDGSGINIDGFNNKELVTLVNHGMITGNGVTGDGDGVDVDGLVNITNTGLIASSNALNGTSEGVTVGGGSIDNSGTIQGSIGNPAGNIGTARGITIAGIDEDPDTGNPIPVQAPYGATTITNSGLIKGDSDAGIAFTSAFAGGFSNTITNTATGTIEGGGTAVALLTGADNDTVNNAGLIKANSSGKAIDLGGGNNTLNIIGGTASVIGDIGGGAGGSNALNFDIGTGNTFSYAGALSNFADVQVNGGTTTLSGASTYSGPTTVNSGSLLVTNGTGSATGSGTVEIKSGAVFGGSGLITGPLTLDLGATLSPGVGSIGTLGVGNTLLDANSTFAIELDPTNSQGYGIADSLRIAGSVALNASDLVITLLSAPTVEQSFDILFNDGSDAVGGLFNQDHYVFGNHAGQSYKFYVDYAYNADGGTLGNDIRLTTIPEPGTGFLLGLGGLAMALERRFSPRLAQNRA